MVANPAVAQIYVSSEFLRSAEGVVKVRIIEEKSDAPIPYASVYLTAKNDTLITNFTLTDTTGLATIKKVARGTYRLTVEMLGYKTYNGEHYFTKEEEDLGVIRLPEDIELLDAARVTAIGNPIEVKQDTIIFNASSFQMGQNQMLEDLLRRMPGMEVGADGSVRYNGETIKKITVGGKTFFFDDPKIALRNLPAKIVDKVKIIDKVSDTEQFTGVATDREKVMDLDLKQEFKQGWFGNVRAGAGATLGEHENDLNDHRGLLYSGNLLLSGYSETDQLTLIGNVYNAPLRGNGDAIISVVYDNDDGNATSTLASGGLVSDAQAGVNYNTVRIKGMDVTGMARYDHSFRDSRSRSERTTFASDGGPDFLSHSEGVLFDRKDDIKVNLELKNTNRKKILFQFSPVVRYNRSRTDQNSESRSEAEETVGNVFLNSAVSASSGESKQLRHEASLAFGLRNLGNSRRNVTLRASYNYTDYDAASRDSSVTRFASEATPLVKDLRYDTDNRNFGSSVGVTYVEPLAKRWVLSTALTGNWTRRDNRKDAFDMPTGLRSEAYSTALQSRYDYYTGSIQFQYRKGQTSLQLGARVQETYHETHSLSRGVEMVTGLDEWLFDWSPYLNFRHAKGQYNLTASYRGSTIRPSAANLLPALDISVPTRLRVGNIYLKPSSSHISTFDVSWNNPKSQANVYVMGNARLIARQSVPASWFDEAGVNYSIPVNAQKPGIEGSIYSNFSLPLSADKRLRLGGNLNFRFGRAVSYQNVRRMEGFDLENFDYTAFMDAFWGDSQGSRFYSGASGFRESVTRSADISPSLSLNYRGDHISVTFSGGTAYSGSRYSLDPTADTHTWSSRVNSFIGWTTSGGLELASRCSYHFFAGFPEGFNDPYVSWDAYLAKSIKQFVIELHLNDILNSTRDTRHIATGNYVEDIQRNQLGRHAFITLKWNFGKLNETRNAKANDVVWQMMY